MAIEILRQTALVARRHYVRVFLGMGLLMALAVVGISQLRFDTDVLRLLPQKDPVIRTYLDTLEEFGTVDYLLVVLRIPEGQVLDPYLTFADRLAGRFEATGDFESIDYRIGEMDELLTEFLPKGVLFLDAEGRQRLEEKVSSEGIRQRVQEIRRQLATPQGMALRDLLVLDPLGLAEIFLGRLDSSRGNLSIDWASGYYVSRDHTMLLMLTKPNGAPQDLPFIRRLVPKMEQAVEEVRGQWPEIVGMDRPASEGEALGGPPPPPPEVAMGGSYLTALDDASFIIRDMVINVLTSAVGVLLLFLLAFRRFGPLLFASLPLVCGLVLTFGFSSVTLGQLSSATSGTAALLIGLGIDFVIVSYGRYVEERRRGKDLESALGIMGMTSGRAVVVGAVTTAATFYAFLTTEFTGLWEMGFLTGTGILFCMASVLVLLPALLAWSEKRHTERDSIPNFYLHSFGTDSIMHLALRRPRTVLVVGAVITVAAGFAAARGLEFQESMRTLRPEGNRGIEVAEEVGKVFGSGFNYMMLVVSAEEPKQLLDLTAEAAHGAQRLVEDGIIYRYDSVSTLIPPPQRQEAVLDWLAAEKADSLNLQRISVDLRQNLRREGLNDRPFQRGLELFAEAVSPTHPLGLEDFTTSQQSQRLLDRFVQRTEKGWKSVVYLYPRNNEYRRVAPVEAHALADQLGPQVVLTGNNVINERMQQRVRQDAWIAGVLGFLLVAVLLYFDFHTVRHAVMALLPLLVGMIWMLGAMSVLDISLNIMNIFVTTMIIGIGVDYGLHAVHRYREVRDAEPEELERGLLETGKAILIASLSTICGFGSLSLSHYPGLKTTGWVAILGALFTALVSISLLPAGFRLWHDYRRRKEPRQG